MQSHLDCPYLVVTKFNKIKKAKRRDGHIIKPPFVVLIENLNDLQAS